METPQLDPQAEALLNQIAAEQAKAPAPARPLSPAEQLAAGRDGYRAVIPLAGPPEPVNKVVDRQIPGPAVDIPARIYTPGDGENLPVLVYFHGGGFTSGGLDTHDAPLRALANRVGCILVAADYRLAPEHPFPAASEDAYAATKWIADHTAEIGGDPSRIAVGGDSAGGNLAAVVALMARDRRGPALVYQVLIYPNTDATLSSASWQELGTKGYILTADGMASSFAQYLPEGTDKKQAYVSPLYAADVKNLPAALMVTGECDPLRNEGEAYAVRLQEAGVPVESRRYDGMIHGFFQMAGVLDQGKKVIEETAESLRAAFAN